LSAVTGAGPAPAQPAEAAIIAAVRAAVPTARALWLFGSRATGHARAESDLDLAVLLPGRADPVTLWLAAQDVAIALKLDVDLIDLIAANTVLQHQIITHGRRLFADHPGEADAYELFILSEKLDLDRMRAPLVAEILREGRVFGK